MPVPILITAAIVAALVLLIVLYRRSRRSPLFGDSLAFPMIFIARPLVKLQGLFEKGASGCDKLVDRMLHYPPGVSNETTHGVLLIAWNVLLLVCSIILSADVYNMLERLPLLFGGAGAVDLPGSFAIPSSLLFVCMSALYGSVILECVDLLPAGVGLFPKMTGKVKKWLGILSAIGLGLSLVFAVLFWVISAYYTSVDPSTPAWLTIPALAIVGIILTGASVLALWGWVLGLLGFCRIVFWLLYSGLQMLAGVVSIVPSQIDVFVQHMTQGRLSVYGELGGHEPYKPPASPFPDYNGVYLPGHTNIVELLERSVSIDEDTDNVQIFPVLTPEKEVKMKNPQTNSAIVFVGSHGSQTFRYAVKDVERLKVDNLLASGLLDLAISHRDTHIPGTTDITPAYPKRYASMLHTDTYGQAYQTLLHLLADNLTAAIQSAKASPGILTFVIDCRHLIDFIEPVESIKRRAPYHSIVIKTSVSQDDLREKEVSVGLSDMQALAQADIISLIIVDDPRSEFASRFGVETQVRFSSWNLVSLPLAHRHSLNNRSFMDWLREVRSVSPYATFSHWSEPVAEGSMPRRFAWLPGISGIGAGIYEDTIAQTRACIDKIMRSDETRTSPVKLSPSNVSLILCSVPYELNNPLFNECVRDNSLYVSRNYSASCVSVRGNGVVLPYQMSRFRVSASCLSSLEPQSLQVLQEVRNTKRLPLNDTKVTPLFPVIAALEPSSSNEYAPVEDKKVVKAKKASTTTRQKKTSASVKRVARKNTTTQAK